MTVPIQSFRAPGHLPQHHPLPHSPPKLTQHEFLSDPIWPLRTLKSTHFSTLLASASVQDTPSFWLPPSFTWTPKIAISCSLCFHSPLFLIWSSHISQRDLFKIPIWSCQGVQNLPLAFIPWDEAKTLKMKVQRPARSGPCLPLRSPPFPSAPVLWQSPPTGTSHVLCDLPGMVWSPLTTHLPRSFSPQQFWPLWITQVTYPSLHNCYLSCRPKMIM